MESDAASLKRLEAKLPDQALQNAQKEVSELSLEEMIQE
jgi:hypothetical protein